MNRKITILASIFLIVMLLFTNRVFAAEKLNYDDGATYVIDEIKPKTDTLGEMAEFFDIDQNNNYIFSNFENGKFYRVNEEECVELSNQEILDFMNSKYYIHNYVENDLNIYQNKMPAYFNTMSYIVTEDKVVDANKEYFQQIEDEHGGYRFELIENPDLTNGTYLEAVFLVFPKSAIIDENITYYEGYKGICNKVENPKAEEVLDYRVIGNLEDYITNTKIGQMTQEVYDKIFLKETSSYYISYSEESNDVFVLVNYMERNKSVIYNSDGSVVVEYDGLMLMNPLGNKFFIIAKCDENWEKIDNKITIIDTEGNTVLESENIPYLEVLVNDKYTTYLKNSEFDVNQLYNIYEYKLLSQDNQKYEGKELQIKTSGELHRLSSVKVNGTELDASNYTKTSGSTIITLKNEYLKTLALGTLIQ